MDWKIEQEWVIMRYFRKYCREFPAGRLRKGESPDFKLWVSPRKFIGIEVTQVHPPPLPDPVPGFLDYRFATAQFRSTLSAKEEKLNIYRKQKPEQIWLLIFADYTETDAIEKILHEAGQEPLRTGYNRVFIFDVDQHRVVSIK